MDCQEVLEFHDDGNRAAERTKETILLMKKKMLRSHDLILQYNDTLKECDRLKGELCMAQQESAKAKWEKNSHHTKLVKLESQIADCKKNENNFQKKIADQEIKIAGDKCHLEQLVCKLQTLESKHSEKLMEEEIKKSSLEGRIKELEAELKKLKKAQLTGANLESGGKPRRGKKTAATQLVVKETVDVGVNTTAENEIFSKSITANKFTLTDEFYHMKSNPYPIFCHKCQVPMKPSIEKFCEVMTDLPPLMEKISSPPPRRASLDESTRADLRTDSLDKLTPEVENLKRKIATLERKMKRGKKRLIRESAQPSGNCCGHSCAATHFSPHGSNPPNLSADLMAEFWNRIMYFSKETSRKFKDDDFAGRFDRKKLSKLKKGKMKISKKRTMNKSVGSTNWQVESDDCADSAEKNTSAESIKEVSYGLRGEFNSDSCSEENSKIAGGSRSGEKSNVSTETRDDRKQKMSEEAISSKQRRSSSRIQEKSLRDRKCGDKMSDSEKSARNSQSDVDISRENVASTIDRLFPVDPVEARRSESDANETAANDFPTPEIDEFPTNSSNDRSNNAGVEYRSEEENSRGSPEVMTGVNGRKRKRSVSPMKKTKKTVKSKLLGKLRALKKNSKMIAATASNNSMMEDSMGETEGNMHTEDSTVNTVESQPKKQRIAHVARKSLSKEREIHRETRSTSEKKEFSPPTGGHESESTIGHSPSYKSPLNCVIVLNSSLKTKISEKISENSTTSTIAEFSSSSPRRSWNLGDKVENSVERQDPPENQEIHGERTSERVESLSEKNSMESTEISGKKVTTRGMPTVFKVVGSLVNRSGVKTLRKNGPQIGILARLSSTETPRTLVSPLSNSEISHVSDSAQDSSKSNVETMSLDRHGDSIDATKSTNRSSRSDEAAGVEGAKLSGTSGTIEESPESPDQSPASPDNPSDSHADSSRSTRKIATNNPSIYENALSPAASPADNFHSPARIEDSQNSIDSNFDDSENWHDNESTSKNIVKDLRTRQVLCSPDSNNSSQRCLEKNRVNSPRENLNETSDSIEPPANQRGIRSLATLLHRHLAETKKKSGTKAQNLRKAAAVKMQIEAEKKVRDEIWKLVESAAWTRDLNANVIASLSQVPSRRTIAKSIVDLLMERTDVSEALDRSYTPPAPVMTRTQQRIAALINGLERDPGTSGVFELVRAGINYNLFRVGYAIQLEMVEPLIRMLTVMARMKKDREGARMLCCNALYSLGRKASNAIYVVMTIWPEVFPMHGTRHDTLVDCLIYLIRSEQSVKAASIKRLLRDYYKYPELAIQSTNLMDSLINALIKEYTGELEISILLIAKREGTEWTYKNIINARLLNIIEDDNYPSLLNALTLLGFLLRTFPVEDENKAVATVVEKLCNMLESSEDCPDKEEGVISALLSLGRYIAHFDRIADSVLRWKPNRPMRPYTLEQLSSFFKLRSVDWWNKRKRVKMSGK